MGGIFHAGFRNGGMGSFAFSVGGSLNVEEFDINSIFTGVSLLLGKRDKVVFTTGPSFRQVAHLNEKYQVGEIVDTNYISEEMLKSNSYKVGWFFGISYNLTNKQRNAIVQMYK